MREVAARAGVSAKTVSRVINNDRYVSADVQRRVHAAIADLAYVPNLLARTFRSGRDAAIGVAVPDVADPFFAAVIHAIERAARERGVAVFVTSLGDDGQREQGAVEALLGRQIVGLITTPVADSQAYLQPWQSRTAVVFIDRPPKKLTGVDFVVQDDHGGARTATEHLLSHGHRHIAILGDRPTLATTQRRIEGYSTALAAAGLPQDPRMIRTGVQGEAAAAEALAALAELDEPPTAIFSSNAACSIALVPALQASAYPTMPVLGFGDFPLAAALQPPYTVIDQDPEQVGIAAATRMFVRIDQTSQRLRRRTTIPVRIVVRESCGTHPDG